jgi:hypothetical protein
MQIEYDPIVGEKQPEGAFRIGRTKYLIFDQGGGEYAVRVHKYGEPVRWLDHPEKHFETLGGAYYAILLDAA